MAQTQHGIPYPDPSSPFPSALWWKSLAEFLDEYVGKVGELPDIAGLRNLLAKKLDRPDEARAGQVLTYNGQGWVAFDPPAGDGTSGDGTGIGLPLSMRGAFLIGTGTDWIVLPGAKTDGQSLIADSTNAYGYRWDTPLPTPAKGAILAATGTAWAKLTPSRDGQVLVADSTQVSGVRWGSSALPNPSRGSVLVADGTTWLPVPWSGKDGQALIVDSSRDVGVAWGGVLPSPLKGALLIGDGVTWRLITAPVDNSVLVSDPTSSYGAKWSNEYARLAELALYATKAYVEQNYVKKSELNALIKQAMANRWSGWQACKLASGWSGSLYANHDGTQLVIKGTAYPSGGAGSTIASTPSGFPNVYAEAITTHVTKIDVNGSYSGVVRPYPASLSGHSVGYGGNLSNLYPSYGVKFSSAVFMVA